VPLSTDRTLREIILESHKTALDHGWWESGDHPILEQLMLMVTELAEAAEEVRTGHQVGFIYYNADRTVETPGGVPLPKPEGFLAELADVLIRMGDTIDQYGLTDQFIAVLTEKLQYNKYRPYRHGGKTA
jgi:hypothetical protein